jgi:type VI secretion system secreted protein VgrG
VAQVLAGSGWGGVFVPRIGQEVVVAFIEGDPDRPLVVGCVYNDQYMPAYSDKEAMKSSLKTVTFTDDSGFNEIRFNDEKDKEEIFVHAQKDVYIDIKYSRKTEIEESDDTLDLFKGSRSVTLQTKDGAVKHSFTIKEGESSVLIEKGDSSITLGDGNLSYDIKGDCSWKISGDLTIKVDGNISIESGKVTTSKSGQDTKMEAGTAFTLKGGTDFKAESGTAMALKAGLNLDAEAGLNMTLKANLNWEAKGGVGVKLGGTMVEIAGTAMSKMSAPMITIGGGMLQLG